jgi:flavodoxin
MTRTSAVVYASIHHGNTRKVAEAIARVLSADLMDVRSVSARQLGGYDMIGFGSGIYFRKHYQPVLALANSLGPAEGRRAFIFSTAGLPRLAPMFHRPLRAVLEEKGYEVAGEFACKGHDSYAIFALVGGINKGRPNAADLDRARQFAKGLRDSSGS